VFVCAAIAAAAGLGLAGFYGTYALLGTALVIAAVAKLRVPGASRVQPVHSFVQALKLPRDVWRFAIWLFPLTFAAPYAALYIQYSTLRLSGAGRAGILQGAIGIGLTVRSLLCSSSAFFHPSNVD